MSGADLADAPSKPVGLSLAGFLVKTIWLSMLPLLLLAVWLAVDIVRSARVERDIDAADLAKNVSIAIDERLKARLGALHVLAVSPLLDDSARWRDFYKEAQGFQQSFDSHVILADVGEPMHMLLNTRVPFGTPLPLLPRPQGKAAAPTAAATGQAAVGDIVFGPVAGEPLVTVAMPVMREGRITHVVLSIFATRQLQRRLEQVALPAGWSLSLLDSTGAVIARRAPPGLNPETDVDDVGRFVVKSEISPWSVVLEIPRVTYRSSIVSGGMTMTLAVFFATLLSFIGGTLASRRLTRAVKSLAEPSMADPAALKFKEIAAVHSVLDEANNRRRAAESIQRESDRRFQATFELAAVGIALVAPDGHWLRVNRKLCEIVGYGREELMTLGFQDITHPEDLNADLDKVQQMLAGEIATYTMEKRYLRKGGSSVWVNLTVALVWRPDGVPDYFVSVVEDIQARRAAETALREAQAAMLEDREQARLAALNQMEDAFSARESAEQAVAALRESQEQLQLFIEHAPASLAMFDREMRYLAVSRRWMVDYSLDARNLVGCLHYEIFPEIPERWREIHGRGMQGEVIRADADRFERNDGSVIWLRWEVHPWHHGDGSIGGIVIFSEDITRFKLAEDEIRQLNASLEQRVEQRTEELTAANRELDSFAYAVSHDLRAPLRAMSGFSQALQEDFGDRLEGDGKVYLEQIGVATRKMSELIEGILVLSRSTRGELQRGTIDLSAMSAGMLGELKRDQPGRGVVAEIQPGLVVDGDPRMIEVVMRNLLENAWKYTTKTSAPAIRVYSGEIAGVRGICVSDNGAGFDMVHAKQLFQPFRRLHRQDEFPGIGIGLATVQRIVHRHGGEIAVHAAVGQGASFCFNLRGETGVI